MFDFPLAHSASMSIEEGEACFIDIDRAQIRTEADERSRLAHELGHCVTGSFYSRYTAVDCRQRHENRADKRAIRRLLSVTDLDKAVAAGYTELWQLADYFGITEDLIKKPCATTHTAISQRNYTFRSVLTYGIKS
ncbi:MAG: ImmA/IrrE family metallo-endopeptidase [Oscillospiraceae bacterium]|nr:ImmA/IrrE family metallo-endopeptidase [Oscillospiraceae bacterium]